MTRDEGIEVRCARCGWWVARVTSTEAEVELNCVNRNCATPLVIRRQNGEVTVAVTQKKTAKTQA